MNKLTFVAIAIAGLWIFSACGSDDTQQEKIVRPVKSITVGGTSAILEKGFPAVTKESQQSEMSFRIGGPIVKYNVVEGAQVKKGDLIAEIDPRDYLIAVQSTQGRYSQAKAESDRYYRLWQKGSVAKNDYDRRYARAIEAKAALDDARNALKDTKLLAPFTGFYGSKIAELGDKVRAKQAITTIVDLSVIEVTTTIPEQLAVKFRDFDKYVIRLETYPDTVFIASLKNLEKKPTPEGFPLHLILDHVNNPKDKTQVKVAAGMSCRVIISLKKVSNEKEQMIIPLTAIFEDDTDKNTKVWVISADSNIVKKQNIIVGDFVGNDKVIIKEGLSIGQQVVIAGVHRLTEGDKVNILK